MPLVDLFDLFSEAVILWFDFEILFFVVDLFLQFCNAYRNNLYIFLFKCPKTLSPNITFINCSASLRIFVIASANNDSLIEVIISLNIRYLTMIVFRFVSSWKQFHLSSWD